MDWSNPIIYELGLTVVALVGFAVWQTVTLKRDMRHTREEDARRQAAEAESAEAPGHNDSTDEPLR